MNLALNNQTMSSEELASLLNLRHDNVRQAANNLKSNGVITFTEISVKGNGRPKMVMKFDRRNSIVMAAKLNDKFMGAVVDRWIELETPMQSQQLPQSKREWIEFALEQEKRLELAAPKVEFHDTIVQSDNTYKYQEAGKKIQQRPNKFVKWLREEKYIDKLNTPYQRYIDQGLFKINSGVSDSGHVFTQGRITNKGLAYFTSKLCGEKL